MRLVGSKPITSNVTVPTTSFLHVFFHKWRHAPCIMTSCIYHLFPINSQYLKTWVVDSPGDEQHTDKSASLSARMVMNNGKFKTLTQFFLVILGKSFMSWTVWDEEFYRWDGSKSGEQERSLWSLYWWKKQANFCRLLCFTGEYHHIVKRIIPTELASHLHCVFIWFVIYAWKR